MTTRRIVTLCCFQVYVVLTQLWHARTSAGGSTLDPSPLLRLHNVAVMTTHMILGKRHAQLRRPAAAIQTLVAVLQDTRLFMREIPAPCIPCKVFMLEQPVPGSLSLFHASRRRHGRFPMIQPVQCGTQDLHTRFRHSSAPANGPKLHSTLMAISGSRHPPSLAFPPVLNHSPMAAPDCIPVPVATPRLCGYAVMCISEYDRVHTTECSSPKCALAATRSPPCPLATAISHSFTRPLPRCTSYDMTRTPGSMAECC